MLSKPKRLGFWSEGYVCRRRLSLHIFLDRISSNTSSQSQQWFYLVWLFLRQTHVTLIKRAQNGGETILKQLDCSLVRGLGQWPPPTSSPPPRKREQMGGGKPSLSPETQPEAATLWPAPFCSLLTQDTTTLLLLFPKWIPVIQSLSLFFFNPSLVSFRGREKIFRQGFLSFSKGNIPGRNEKSEQLRNHSSGYWPWVVRLLENVCWDGRLCRLMLATSWVIPYLV